VTKSHGFFMPAHPFVPQSMLSQDFDDDDMPNVVWVESPKADPPQGCSQQVLTILT
jgi:hypothetical protein